MAFRPTKNAGEALRAAGALGTVGFAFVLALVIGFWIGSRLDAWLNTTPLFTIVFFFVGLAAGILNVVRAVSQAYPSGSGATPPPASRPAPGSSPNQAGPSDRELSNGDE